MSPTAVSARLAVFAALLCLAAASSANAQVVQPRRKPTLSELATQLEEMQLELTELRERDAARKEWEASIVDRLPALDEEDEENEDDEDGDDADDLVKLLTPLSGDCGKITFKPGLRIQPRYIYDDFNDNHDFFIRRFRLKTSGNAFGIADYGLELKIDSSGRILTDHTPDAVVENAWLDFPLCDKTCLRVGLYDAPFSRNALTSDSKLLFMDRSLIFGDGISAPFSSADSLSGLGLADNTIGLMLHARPFGGHLEYAVGIFDDIKFERFTSFAPTVLRDSTDLMPGGRVVWNVLDPPTSTDACPDCAYADYKGSYIGEGQRLALGVNVIYLPDCEVGQLDPLLPPTDRFDLFAWGADVFFNAGPWVFEAEYDKIHHNIMGVEDYDGEGWYVQGGYLLNYCQYQSCPCSHGYELALRYQEFDPNDLLDGDRLRWTSIGLNIYIRDHNLKIQTDYTFKSEDAVARVDNNIYQIQLQLDY